MSRLKKESSANWLSFRIEHQHLAESGPPAATPTWPAWTAAARLARPGATRTAARPRRAREPRTRAALVLFGLFLFSLIQGVIARKRFLFRLDLGEPVAGQCVDFGVIEAIARRIHQLKRPAEGQQVRLLVHFQVARLIRQLLEVSQQILGAIFGEEEGQRPGLRPGPQLFFLGSPDVLFLLLLLCFGQTRGNLLVDFLA